MSTVLETSKVPGIKPLYHLSLFTAAFSGVLCAAFTGILLYNHFLVKETGTVPPNEISYRQPATDSFNILPTDEQEIHRLKEQLAADKQNVALQEQVRNLDMQLRLSFFQRRERVDILAPILLFTAIVFVISTRSVAVLKRKIPLPSGVAETTAKRTETERLRLGTASITALAALFVGLALGLLLLPSPSFETVLAETLMNEEAPAGVDSQTANAGEGSGTKPEAEPPFDREKFLTESAAHHTSFLAPFSGNADDLPVKWDATSGENIVWKTEVPMPGNSSPVIWGDKLFLTGADESKRQVFCFSAADGKLLWTADCPSTSASETPFEPDPSTGFAAPTAVTNGRQVAALFANGDLAAFDFNGKCLWNKSLGIPESSYGFAASPALYFDRVIVQYDVSDGSDGKSKLYCFEMATGKIVWETPREIPNSWSSPIVRKIGDGWQVITCGDPFVISYDPETGKELWRVKCLSGDVGPSPSVFGNFVFVSNQMPRSTVIDTSLSPPDIVWQGTNALPDTPSPIAAAERFFTLDSGGYLTGYDPKSVQDKKVAFWELEIGEGMASFYSSPFLAGQRMYLFSKDEKEPRGFVVDLSQAKTDEDGMLTEESAEAMRIAANPMSEPCVSSPAAVGGKLFIRGTKTLFCIGTK